MRESSTSSESERDGSELSDTSLTDGQKNNGYSLEQIQHFLEKTKSKHDVNIEGFSTTSPCL